MARVGFGDAGSGIGMGVGESGFLVEKPGFETGFGGKCYELAGGEVSRAPAVA